MAVYYARNPGHNVIEHSDVYGMEVIRPVQVVHFEMQLMPNDTRDRPRTDGLEPIIRYL